MDSSSSYVTVPSSVASFSILFLAVSHHVGLQQKKSMELQLSPGVILDIVSFPPLPFPYLSFLPVPAFTFSIFLLPSPPSLKPSWLAWNSWQSTYLILILSGCYRYEPSCPATIRPQLSCFGVTPDPPPVWQVCTAIFRGML